MRLRSPCLRRIVRLWRDGPGAARQLRACPGSSLGSGVPCDPSEHEADHAEAEEGEGVAGEVLEVLGQPSAATEPSEGPLDDPALRERHEALLAGPADDFQAPTPGPGDGARGRSTLVGTIGEDHLHEREQPASGAQQRDGAVTVLDVGGMDRGVQQEAERVDQDVPLLAGDLFPRVVTLRVDLRPPFSALLTLWLSTIATVGLASLPTCSRVCTKRA